MKSSGQFKDKWLTAGDLKLHYLDWGNPSAPPMFLVHGQSGCAHNWDFFATSFREDYHIIAMDLRGHGESTWAGDYVFERYAGDISRLVDELDLNDFVLIGHSLGGVNSIIYASANPHRVSRLVIVDIGPEINPVGIKEMQKRIANEPVIFNTEEEAAQQMKKEHPYYFDEFSRNLVKYNMKRDTSGKLVYKYDPKVRRARPGSHEFLWKELEDIVCPTLIVRGAESDLLTRETALRMAKVLPFGSEVEISHATHTVMGDNPEAFESAVRQFLNK